MWARRRAVAVFAALGAAISGIAVACSIYDSSLLLPGADSGGSDVVEAGAPDVREADAGPAACPELFPPAAPATDDPSDAGQSNTFVTALHTIEVLDDAGGAPLTLGYDLDGVYTCCDGGAHNGAPSCKPFNPNANLSCDDPLGRDNNAGQLLSVLASLSPGQFNTTTISQRLAQGVYSIILQVLEYNGTPNDTKVTAALYAANGIEGDASAQWNGTDSWLIDQSFVVDPDASPILPIDFDGKAYVSNGVLVMHVDFPIALGTTSTGTFTITLSGGTITANVVPAGNGTYRLTNGQMVGRWKVSDLLAAVETVTYQGKPICRGGAIYEGLVKPKICDYVDIMSDHTQDLTGATCDAISLAFGFTADPAVMGPVVAHPNKTSPCEAGVGAEPDTCGSM